jgi:hypothetical protein
MTMEPLATNLWCLSTFDINVYVWMFVCNIKTIVDCVGRDPENPHTCTYQMLLSLYFSEDEGWRVQLYAKLLKRMHSEIQCLGKNDQ